MNRRTVLKVFSTAFGAALLSRCKYEERTRLSVYERCGSYTCSSYGWGPYGTSYHWNPYSGSWHNPYGTDPYGWNSRHGYDWGHVESGTIGTWASEKGRAALREEAGMDPDLFTRLTRYL